MTLEPRRVEPKALKRWLKGAWALMRRSFSAWLVLSAGSALLFGIAGYMVISGWLAAVGFAAGIVCCGVILVFGTNLAAYTDQSLTKPSIHSLFSKDSMESAYLLFALRRVLKSMGLSLLLLGVLMGAAYFYVYIDTGEIKTLFGAFPRQQGLAKWFVPLAFAPIAMSNIYHFARSESHIDRYLLGKHGVSWEASEVLVKKASLLNLSDDSDIVHAFQLAFVPLIVVSAILLLVIPGGAILSVLCALPFPLLPCLFYVRFRDIYLGRVENKPEAVKERSSVPAKAVGSQV